MGTLHGLRLDVEHLNPLRDCGGKRRKARIPVMLQLGLKGDRMVIGSIVFFFNIQFGTLVMHTICLKNISGRMFSLYKFATNKKISLDSKFVLPQIRFDSLGSLKGAARSNQGVSGDS